MLSLLKRLRGKNLRDIFRFVRRKFLVPLTRSATQRRVDDPNVEVVHVMFNDKFNKPFVDFLNRNFDSKKHLVLCLRANYGIATPFPVGDNVVEIFDIRKIDLSGEHIKKIICHSLFDVMLVEKLYNEPELLKKSCWIMWGGDLYDAPRDDMNDFVRKNFGQYNLGADAEYAFKKYGIIGDHFYAPYQFPLTKQILDGVISKKDTGIRVQINNSSSQSTLEIIDVLSKFKNENIKITTVLSYGDLDFKHDIIEKGRSVFGDNFYFLDKMISPSGYAQFIADNDIVILNQRRQQGFGNTIASIYLGKKVFIRGDVSVPNWLKKFGINIYDTRLITEYDFSEFTKDIHRDKNMKSVSIFFDEHCLAEMWKDFF